MPAAATPIQPRVRAFTLIELLVVVAVIAILAGILLPVLSRARDKARGSMCAANMKQLGTGFKMYVNDNNEAYPGVNTNDLTNAPYANADWSGPVGQFYAPDPKAFVCPADRVGGFAPYDCANGFTCKDNGSLWLPVVAAQGQYAVGNDAVMVQTFSAATKNDWQMPRKSYAINEVMATNASMIVKEGDQIKPDSEIMLCESGDEMCTFAVNTTEASILGMSGCTNGGSRANLGDAGQLPQACTPAQALAAKAAFRTAGIGPSLASAINIVSLGWDRHGKRATAPDTDTSLKGAANYMMCDGHTERLNLVETLNVNDFKWGKILYSAPDRPKIMDNAGTTAVQ